MNSNLAIPQFSEKDSSPETSITITEEKCFFLQSQGAKKVLNCCDKTHQDILTALYSKLHGISKREEEFKNDVRKICKNNGITDLESCCAKNYHKCDTMKSKEGERVNLTMEELKIKALINEAAVCGTREKIENKYKKTNPDTGELEADCSVLSKDELDEIYLELDISGYFDE